MALVARLPVELYRHIVEDVPSTQDLCRLLVTSRTLNDEAERVLYQTLYIDTRPSSKPHSSLLATSLIVHLITCPRVARHVKTLTVRAWLPEAAELITTLFRPLPHLTTLTFYPHYSRVFYTGYATMEAGYLLQGCASGLRQLTYRGALDAGFINFLHAQPSIIDFVWEEYNDGPTIPSTVLPNLSILRGSGDLLQRLLPGRPITRFKWEEVTFFKSLALLSSLRQGLECLSISPGGWPLQMRLPSLYFLELTLSLMQRNALMSWLPNLPSLRIVAINCPADLPSDVFYSLVGEMFKVNTSLSRVEIYSPTSSDMLVIWNRGAVQPEVVRNIFMSEIRRELWKMV